MRKFKSVFILGVLAIGLGLTSCSSDDSLSSSTAKEKGDTYVAISLTMPSSSSTRATNSNQDYNDIGQWVGKDEIKTVDIYLDDGTSVTDYPFTVGGTTNDGYSITKDNNNIVLKPKTAIKTTAGNKSVYVVINTNDKIKTALSNATASTFADVYKTSALSLSNSGTSTTVSTSASNLIGTPTTSGDDVIAMTNASDVNINVVSGITEAQTLADPDPQNRAKVQVQRAVGRVMVTTADTSYPVTSDPTSTTKGSTIGTISNISWVLAQGENSLFVQQNSAFTTPNSAWVPASTGVDADYITNAGDKYDYSGLFEKYDATTKFGGTTVPTLTAYKYPSAAGIGDTSVLNGKFILPTTHTYGSDVTTTGYRKGNTPYVLIRAKFTPAAFADGGSQNTDGTFYLGANGKYYTTAANAVDPSKFGVSGQTVAKYVGGKVLYYAWVNPDQIPGWLNSPVLRNNIYHIHITGFKTIGTNWNPLYPEDPNSSKPTNPDPKPANDDPNDPNNPGEPTNPIDPTDPLTTPKTWMSVDVTILPWEVHSYGVDLGI